MKLNQHTNPVITMILIYFYLLSPNCTLSRKSNQKTKKFNNLTSTNLSEVLFLTPYVKSGKIEEARRLSKVHDLPGIEIESYSGFVTVNAKFNSNIFFWFFPALSGQTNAPLLLWLQGGPGSASMFGLFDLNGPLVVDSQGDVSIRNYTWNRQFAMIFIDQPVGTGFSFTQNDRGYAQSEDDVARDLHNTLEQFFTIFPQYRLNAFYITGESYAGKYVPALAHKIHLVNRNRFTKFRINLQGLVIGAPASDPINQVNYGELFYQIGMVDWKEREHFYTVQAKYTRLIRQRKYAQATVLQDILLDQYFPRVTGSNFRPNYLFYDHPKELEYYQPYLELSQTRRAIHVGNLHYGEDSTIVYDYMLTDNSMTVAPLIENLLNANYRILIYNGYLDATVPLPLTENFINKLKWKSRNKYLKARRTIYKVKQTDKQVAGYIRQADNLCLLVIRNAGHYVPYDQPRVALDMITRFVNEIDF